MRQEGAWSKEICMCECGREKERGRNLKGRVLTIERREGLGLGSTENCRQEWGRESEKGIGIVGS